MENFENRSLAKKPVMDLELLDPYPLDFEKYYNDTFALRSKLIRWFNIFNILVLKKSPLPDKMIIGKDGWLFLASERLEAFLGTEKFAAKELSAFKNEFVSNQIYLKSKQCRYYIMVVPTKANVYPEYIPLTYRKLDSEGWGEQLINYINKNSDVKMIDLFSFFKKVKSKAPLYYKTDLHWNSYGAFHAANAAVEMMSPDIPGLEPLAMEDFKITPKPIGIGDIRHMAGDLDMYEEIEYEFNPLSGFKSSDAAKQNYPVSPGFFDPPEYERVRAQNDSTKPRLLIFSDSFGRQIFPFLSEHFSRTVKIFDGWEYKLHREIVENEKPDVVLIIMYEAYIRNMFVTK